MSSKQLKARRAKSNKAGVTAKPKRPWTPDRGPVLTPEEAADYLGVKPRMIWRLMDEGHLPKIKVGKLVRLDKKDLDDYIARRRVTVGS
jgi:excisionase family DNA binding protein